MGKTRKPSIPFSKRENTKQKAKSYIHFTNTNQPRKIEEMNLQHDNHKPSVLFSFILFKASCTQTSPSKWAH